MVMIITGSTGGIGRCMAERAADSRDIEKIYCMYRNKEKWNAWSYAGHPKIIPVWHDASGPGENQQLMNALYETKPDSIACIHTAFSITPIKRAGTYLPDEIRQNISVNVMDMVFLVNSLLQFRQSGGTQLRIINIDSGAADKPLEGWGMYAAAKAYTNMFLRSVGLENPDVKTVSYEPGVVDTQMQEEIRQTDSSVCGQAVLFREYYKKGMLRDPDAVAGNLFVRFVENWDGKGFREGFQENENSSVF